MREERRGGGGGKARVKVAIRVRPFIEKEKNENGCIDFRSETELVIGGDRSYKFDRVFREDSPQASVYEQCIRELVLNCFDGYNAAVLAYGQTGSTDKSTQVAKHSQWALRPVTLLTSAASASFPGQSTRSFEKWQKEGRKVVWR